MIRNSPILKILIVDDHYMVAKLLKSVLIAFDDIHIVGIAKNSEEIDKYLGIREIDIILLDIDMPQQNGLEILKRIKSDYDSIKVIMLTNHAETLVIKKSISLGANGYLSKFSDSNEIIDAIRSVYAGVTYLCKTSMKKLLTHIKQTDNIDNYKLELLSKRESDVLTLLIENKTSKEISDQLYISVRTVETHRKNILEKTRAKSTRDLVRIVLESDLIELIKA